MIVRVTQLYIILTSLQVYVQLTSYIKLKVILYDVYDFYCHFNFNFKTCISKITYDMFLLPSLLVCTLKGVVYHEAKAKQNLSYYKHHEYESNQ